MSKISQSKADLLLALKSDEKEALHMVLSLSLTVRPWEKDLPCLLFH